MSKSEVYVGDGVYARYNGQELVLRTDSSEIWLDAGMLKQLQSMVDNFDPTPSDDGRAWPQADNE